ncbi:hypothetical protein PoB_000783300 [Plakobranchus ocellatus]|uniref:Uncharacterized protein n=1 Tax=Plakobranchus ocellatus TaxID=259542 RepID=A0AAV3YFZ3_9GAST|nr:hypothetical protein PoB_000783300 [Plakobranchus ocellatus]
MTSGGSAEKLTMVAMPAATLWLRMCTASLRHSLENFFSTIWRWVSFGHNRMGDLLSISYNLEMYDQHTFASPTRKHLSTDYSVYSYQMRRVKHTMYSNAVKVKKGLFMEMLNLLKSARLFEP